MRELIYVRVQLVVVTLLNASLLSDLLTDWSSFNNPSLLIASTFFVMAFIARYKNIQPVTKDGYVGMSFMYITCIVLIILNTASDVWS